MNTALAASASTALRPRRSGLSGWMTRALAAIRIGDRRPAAQPLDREELARRHQLRQDARRLREEQFRAGAYARLL
ncbi:hypothetical protein PX701_09430 [Agromyces sp. H3Y2-19a]|uniref:hypothetical protein n=2 Tax=Agromyces TaxID=33877 RepID=UPI0023B9B98D|nr:hypothetical protein [Agromyces chromiiresistens]MDF0513840.1 hypothetical protein [Agromyces chromiiresistens]